jgi:hypothetical protein
MTTTITADEIQKIRANYDVENVKLIDTKHTRSINDIEKLLDENVSRIIMYDNKTMIALDQLTADVTGIFSLFCSVALTIVVGTVAAALLTVVTMLVGSPMFFVMLTISIVIGVVYTIGALVAALSNIMFNLPKLSARREALFTVVFWCLRSAIYSWGYFLITRPGEE